MFWGETKNIFSEKKLEWLDFVRPKSADEIAYFK